MVSGGSLDARRTSDLISWPHSYSSALRIGPAVKTGGCQVSCALARLRNSPLSGTGAVGLRRWMDAHYRSAYRDSREESADSRSRCSLPREACAWKQWFSCLPAPVLNRNTVQDRTASAFIYVGPGPTAAFGASGKPARLCCASCSLPRACRQIMFSRALDRRESSGPPASGLIGSPARNAPFLKLVRAVPAAGSATAVIPPTCGGWRPREFPGPAPAPVAGNIPGAPPDAGRQAGGFAARSQGRSAGRPRPGC